MAASAATERQLHVNADGVLLSWGAEFERAFGYTEAEVVGSKVDFLIPKRLRALHWRGFNRAVERGRLRRPGKIFRAVGIHKDGSLVAFRSIDELDFTDDGTVEGVTATILRQGWRSHLARMTSAHAERDRVAPHAAA